MRNQPTTGFRGLTTLSIGLLVVLPACVGPVIGPVIATPQRPTVSSDTNTTGEGTFELETGVQIDPDDSYSFPSTFKWGQGERTELFLTWSPLVVTERIGQDGSGTGDVTIGTRHRFIDEVDDVPSFAFQLATKLPTADPSEGTGTGETDWFGSLIATKSFGRASATAYYQFGVLGDPAANSDVDIQQTLSLAAGFPLDERASVFTELTGQLTPAQDQQSLFVISGGTFAVSDSFVLDAAVLLGLSEDAPDFQLLFGATKNFGALGSLWSRADPSYP